MRALLLVNLQLDFLPMGMASVTDSEKLPAIANQIMTKFDKVIAVRDWHPADHVSFAANHLWRYPQQVLELEGRQQMLWPTHCVQDTFGAHFAPELDLSSIDQVLDKNTKADQPGYSAFSDTSELVASALHQYLHTQQFRELFVMGLTTEYDIKDTVLDALHLGYTVNVLEDACCGLDWEAGATELAKRSMQEQGARILLSTAL